MKRFPKWMFVCVFALLAGGCGVNRLMPWSARKVVVSEVLQQRKSEKIYLKCNLWYQDPKSVGCQNIQQGHRLRIGTEVEPLSSDDLKLRFRDKRTGAEYTVVYDTGLMIKSMREYIRDVLTIEPPDKLLGKIDAKKRAAIESGRVVKGMSRYEVMLAWGAPVPSRTPALENSTWVYWKSPDDSLRVIFRGDKVRNIYRFNPQKKAVSATAAKSGGQGVKK